MGTSREYVLAPPVTFCACSWDPKANIMIDNDGRALLTDSALTALIPAQSTFISTCLEDDTIRWISPEILKQKGWPTMESDCYALGMVIYEVLSGGPPFGTSKRSFILREVMGGKHPERPQGEGGNLFTDAIWDMVKLCWKAVPSERASARDVLLCLGEGSTMDGASADCGRFCSFHPNFLLIQLWSHQLVGDLTEGGSVFLWCLLPGSC